MSVLAQLERLDHRLAGMPETAYVFEARKFRLRLVVVALMTFVSLVIAVASNAPVAGWLLVAFALATGAKTVLDLRAFKARVPTRPAGSWYER